MNNLKLIECANDNTHATSSPYYLGSLSTGNLKKKVNFLSWPDLAFIDKRSGYNIKQTAYHPIDS